MAPPNAAGRNAKPAEKDFKITASNQIYRLVRPNGSKLRRVDRTGARYLKMNPG